MDRRKFLTLTASAGVTTLAGCAGDSGDAPAESAGKQTPSPTPTAEPTATPYPEPQKQSFSGYGQTATDMFSPQLPGATAIAMSHSGRRNFSIWLLDSRGERQKLLVNVIGSYTGVGLFGLADQAYSMEIDADGEWNVEVRSLPAYDRGQNPPAVYKREYRSFVGPLQLAGGERVTFSAASGGNNAVWLRNRYGQQADLLFNEIGQVNGASTRINNSGVGYLDVQSNGKWNIQIE